ncbi:MAG: DNA polymerase III subunit epsilon [Bauldia sp.]
MREIVLDTETTGLDFANDRIIEIGCVELINHIPSGRTFQIYINPQRPISIESQRVHGISDKFLADKPIFAAAVPGFLDFIADAPLIAHNADFDIGFLNAELARIGQGALAPGRVIDSLALARRRHPAGPNSLDAICNRYGVDLSKRTVHGALLDAGLLGEVYVELIGGRQTSLAFGEAGDGGLAIVVRVSRPRPAPWVSVLSDGDIAAHAAFMSSFDKGGLWAGYRQAAAAA